MDEARGLEFRFRAWTEFEWWLDHDRKTATRIRRLLKETRRTPFEGTGKPEPLKYHVGLNVWSRRITDEHRLVYDVRPHVIVVHQVRFHYDDLAAGCF
ncbi:MAG: Txe/YoeB family addiction module toxin [Cellulomonadaceae bacterium]|nr:Txe/YoeB family addiction module toxin [Cellulomonadaceae bacterium]